MMPGFIDLEWQVWWGSGATNNEFFWPLLAGRQTIEAPNAPHLFQVHEQGRAMTPPTRRLKQTNRKPAPHGVSRGAAVTGGDF